MNFYVKGQTLTRAGKETIATEAVNFPNVEFTFDSSWDGVSGRTALFQNVNTIFNAVTPASAAGNTAYAVLLTSLGDGRYSCVVPHEVLEGEEAKKFIVTVFGGSTSSKRITTNPVTCEVVPSMYDPGQTPGTPTPSQWDQVVDLLEDIDGVVDDVPGLVADVSDLENEIADARIDTNDTTWPSLGEAIRGQVTGFKNYMQYSGFLAEVTIEEGKRWVESSGHVTLVDPSDETVSAISAKILYNPTACYIRMRNVNHSGEFTEWWGLNSEEELIQSGTNLVNSRFIFNDLNRGIVEIRFNSDTEKIAAAQVICSNETYGYMYDDNVENIKTTDWLLNNVTNETQIANATANYGQKDITLDPALQIGDLVHIVGTTTGNLPLSMKFYRSGRPIEQKFYDVQKSPTTIDMYVHIENSTLDTFRVWSKYPNHYNITVYKVAFEGGASSLSNLSDTAITSPSNGQVLTYDNTSGKWINSNPSGGGHVYSTTEQAVGTFFNSTVYEKSYLFTDSVGPNATITLDSHLDSGTVSWIWLQNISLRDTSSGNIYATENIRGIGTTVASTSSGLQLTNNASGITISMGIVTVRYLKVS